MQQNNIKSYDFLDNNYKISIKIFMYNIILKIAFYKHYLIFKLLLFSLQNKLILYFISFN